jgi:hypothetical protein
MGSASVELLAERFAGYFQQASTDHHIFRLLVDGAEERVVPGDGTITLSVDYAAWEAAKRRAALPPPEPLDNQTEADATI